MGNPITTKKSGDICFAFPDVCRTQVGPSQVPIPYPNIGQLGEAQNAAQSVRAGGNFVITVKSFIQNTTGAEAALTDSGVISNKRGGPVVFKSHSNSVRAGGEFVVRMFDTTGQNCSDKDPNSAMANATGTVLGGEPTVLVGD